jgi:uncharacterized protein with HEPN domain
MKRTYRDYLLDILSSMQEIEDFVRGMDFEEFTKDKKTINAVITKFGSDGRGVKENSFKNQGEIPRDPLEIHCRYEG